MKDFEIGALRMKLYSSCKEMPIKRHQEFLKLSLQASGIGDNMVSIGAHFTHLAQFIQADEKEKAMQELINIHNNFYYLLNGISIKSVAFISYIHSINGKPLVDLSEENVEKIIEMFDVNGVTEKHVEEHFIDLKKNLTQSFNPTFLLDTEMSRLSG